MNRLSLMTTVLKIVLMPITIPLGIIGMIVSEMSNIIQKIYEAILKKFA